MADQKKILGQFMMIAIAESSLDGPQGQLMTDDSPASETSYTATNSPASSALCEASNIVAQLPKAVDSQGGDSNAESSSTALNSPLPSALCEASSFVAEPSVEAGEGGDARLSSGVPAVGAGSGDAVKENAEASSPSEDAALRAKLLQQLERRLSSEAILGNDALVALMDVDQYIPLDRVMALADVKALTTDRELILDVLNTLKYLEVDPLGTKVRPKFARTELVLRQIPKDTPKHEVEALFSGEGCPPVISCQYSCNSCWTVKFRTEIDALQAHFFVKDKRVLFQDKPVLTRIKANSMAKAEAFSLKTEDSGPSAADRAQPQPHVPQPYFPQQYGSQRFRPVNTNGVAGAPTHPYTGAPAHPYTGAPAHPYTAQLQPLPLRHNLFGVPNVQQPVKLVGMQVYVSTQRPAVPLAALHPGNRVFVPLQHPLNRMPYSWAQNQQQRFGVTTVGSHASSLPPPMGATSKGTSGDRPHTSQASAALRSHSSQGVHPSNRASFARTVHQPRKKSSHWQGGGWRKRPTNEDRSKNTVTKRQESSEYQFEDSSFPTLQGLVGKASNNQAIDAPKDTIPAQSSANEKSLVDQALDAAKATVQANSLVAEFSCGPSEQASPQPKTPSSAELTAVPAVNSDPAPQPRPPQKKLTYAQMVARKQ